MSKHWYIKECGQVCFKSDNAELNGWDIQSLVDCLNGKEEKIAKLEAKLAESESKIKVGEFWHSAYQGKQQDYDKVYAELRQLYDEIAQLKQQLAEKEEEIEKWNDVSLMLGENKAREYLDSLSKSKIIDLFVCHLISHNQDKIELLEKVKDIAENCWEYEFDIGLLFQKEKFNKEINTLIKEIKGGGDE